MKGIKHLSIESGPRCSRAHEWCPVTRMGTRTLRMTPRHAQEVIRAAIARGFDGEVGFHFYNEPTLYQGFARAVIAAVPEARYVLWTNGDNITEDFAALFGRVVVTDYGDLAGTPHHPNLGVMPSTPDDRADIYGRPSVRTHIRCFRPFFELPIDCEGNAHLCCQDWRGNLGNVIDGMAPVLDYAAALRKMLAEGTHHAPEVCTRCTNRMPEPL